MTAFHSMMLSGHGLPEMPSGGSVESRLKSGRRRRRGTTVETLIAFTCKAFCIPSSTAAVDALCCRANFVVGGHDQVDPRVFNNNKDKNVYEE